MPAVRVGYGNSVALREKYLSSGRVDSEPDFGARDTWAPVLALPRTRNATLNSLPEIQFLSL